MSGGAGTPSVIFMGRCYQTAQMTLNYTMEPTGKYQLSAVCYDLRTGQIYYAIPVVDGGITPTHISYWYGTGEASGVTAELLQ